MRIGMNSRLVFALALIATHALAQEAPAAAPHAVFDRHTPVEKIAADPDGAAVLNKDMPGLLTHPSYSDFKGMSLRQLQEMSGGDMSKEDVEKTEADLMALSQAPAAPAH
jgi:hypothetical protein